MQPTPRVTIADVQRILRREFPPPEEPAAARLLAEYARGDPQAGPRTMLAVLKLAGGDLEELRRAIDIARTDYRDVLMIAEYPRDSKIPWNSTMPAEERQKIYDADWRDYEEWLNRA